MTYLFAILIPAAGLTELKNTLLQNWLGPAFVIAVAVFAIMFLKDRQWMKLIGFVGIAAVVGLLMFSGGTFFGDGSVGNKGSLTKVAEDGATSVANNDSTGR